MCPAWLQEEHALHGTSPAMLAVGHQIMMDFAYYSQVYKKGKQERLRRRGAALQRSIPFTSLKLRINTENKCNWILALFGTS